MTAIVTIVGGLVRPPELKFLDSGKAMARFSLAEARRIKQHDGTWQDGPTSFYDVTVFGRAAEHLTNSRLLPGDELVVTGRVEVRQWDKPDGTKGSATSVTADAVGVSVNRRPVEPLRDLPSVPEPAQPQRRSPDRSAEQWPIDDDMPPF